MTGPIKADLDRRMLRTLKAMARRRGEDHHAVTLPHGSTTICAARSALDCRHLRVPHNVAEAVLAHRQGGIVATYDLHEYQDEKAEALEAWAQRIASIVNPACRARQGRQAAGAAAMISVERFAYTDAQWGDIKTVVRDELDRDADQIVLESARMDGTKHDETLRAMIEGTASSTSRGTG